MKIAIKRNLTKKQRIKFYKEYIKTVDKKWLCKMRKQHSIYCMRAFGKCDCGANEINNFIKEQKKKTL